MSSSPNNAASQDAPTFPFITVGLAAGVLFAFLFLMWFVTTLPKAPDTLNPEAAGEPKPDAAAKLDEVNGRNEAALNGVGAKMSREKARGELLGTLKGPNDRMPFPTPEPLPPSKKDEPKKEEKKP